MNRLSEMSNQESDVDEEVCDSQDKYSNFQSFLSDLGHLINTKLDFDFCNRFMRFKRNQYLSNDQVIDYHRNIFGKKTITSMRRKWHIKDKFVLFWVISKYCEKKHIQDYKMTISDWDQIASILRLCRRFIMRKWICLLRHTTFHFHWNPIQQVLLTKYMADQQYEAKWSELSLKIFEESGVAILRTCKDIRERWKNYLDPNLKRTQWNEQQDNCLIHQIKKQGKKWSLISKKIPGRTQNQVKNRFITLSKKNKFLFQPDEDVKEDPHDQHQVQTKLQNLNYIKCEFHEHEHSHDNEHSAHENQQIMSHQHHETHESMEQQQIFIEAVLQNNKIFNNKYL